MARSTARKRALNTLYEADEKSQDILSLLDERIKFPGSDTPLPEYAITLVQGVANHLQDCDALITAHAKGWTLRRMPVLDRNILRLATWEICCNDEVPDKVAIDEALTLAKTLCDDAAPSFIHGVLSAICEDPRARLISEQSSENLREDEQLNATEQTPTGEGQENEDIHQ